MLINIIITQAIIMKKLHNHIDISTKYAFIKLSEIIHDYFILDEEYIHPVETEV